MNIENILITEKMAKEFLERVKGVKEKNKGDVYCFFGCKETSALKRISLDLSRSLSEMRKP